MEDPAEGPLPSGAPFMGQVDGTVGLECEETKVTCNGVHLAINIVDTAVNTEHSGAKAEVTEIYFSRGLRQQP